MKRLFLVAITLAVLSSAAAAQIITTVAGGGPADGVAATSVGFGTITGAAVDGNGNTYFAAPNLNTVFKVAPDGKLYRVAGVIGTGGFGGDGGPATSAFLRYPYDVDVDASGNVYIADANNYRVRKVDTNGIITTVAGNGTFGFAGDGGQATSASLTNMYSIALDGSGNLFIGDINNYRVRRVAPNGVITTYAGNGTYGYSGDGGAATAANITYPYGMDTDSAGNLFIVDLNNYRIRRVSTAGTITTVAGNGNSTHSGDNGPATSAGMQPRDVAVDATGRLFIADSNNYRVRMVTSGGTISTFAGTGSSGSSGDGISATSAPIQPLNVTISAATLIISDNASPRLRTVTAGIINTIAGNGSFTTFGGDGGPATSANLAYPFAVARDGQGNVFIADSDNYRIRKVSPQGIITTIAGTGTSGFAGDGGPAINARIGFVYGIAVNSAGHVYFTDGARIRKVANGIISSVAGTGTYGFSGDGGPATSAMIASPYGVAVDTSGNLYIADGGNHRIRKVDASTGIISTVAGNGSFGYPSSNVAATSTSVPQPRGVAVDATGKLSISSRYQYTQQWCIYQFWNGYYWECVWQYQTFSYNFIQRVSGGIITSLVNGTSPGFSGDGGSSQFAQFSDPWGIAVDSSGNLYIADLSNHRIRKITPAGIISTVAGNGSYGFSGDGGPPLAAQLAYPYGVAAASDGSLYIADYQNHRIRQVSYNSPPVADAGDDVTLEATGPTTNVTLDGSGSSDPNVATGDTLTYEWRDSTNAVVGGIPQKTLPLPLGVHTFTLTVTDSFGASSTDSVTITVEDTTPPDIDIVAPVAGTYQLNQSVLAIFACTDLASTVSSCVGTSESGQLLDTATAGPKTFTVNASDAHGNPATLSVSYTVATATPAITWQSPSAIVHGTALGASQLNASTSVAGTFAYSPASGTVLNAGNNQTLSVTFTPNDTANYQSAAAQVTINVTRAAPSVTVVGGTFTYDGSPHPASATVTGVGGALTPVVLTYNGNPAQPVNAGSYAVLASFAGDANHEPASGIGTINIGKATAVLSFVGLQATYDGSPKAVEVTTSPGSLTGVTILYEGSATPPTNAGTYAVSASLTHDNYQAAALAGTLTIAKAAASVTLGSLSATYDASSKSATATTNPANLTVVLTYNQGGTPVAAPTDAGSYAVLATIQDANYQGSAVDVLTIHRASAVITLGNLLQTYNGSPRSADATTTPAGLTGLSVTYDGSPTAPTNAGSYAVAATLMHNNYEAADVTGTLVISKATAEITLGGLTAAYDGTPKPVSAATTPGALTGVAVTYNGSPTAPTNAGSYAVSATLTNDNYQAVAATGTLVISKASAAISLANLSQTYNGSPRSADASTNPAGLAGISFTYDGTPAAPTNAGSYAVVATLTHNNYEAAAATGTLVISKAGTTITLGNLSQTYNGSPHSVDATTTPAGLTGISITYDGSPAPPTNAGSYAVVATLTHNNYEAAAVNGTLVINKATATISLGGLSATYDGSPKSASAATTPLGLAGVSVTYNGSPTPPTNAGGHQVVASLLHPNYAAANAVGTLTIAKASQTISFAAISGKTFGDPPFGISATATSLLPVSFATSGSCTLSGGMVTINSGGVCTITASQPGDGNYLAALPVSQSFGVAYSWSGVLQPVNQDGSSIFKLGRTVPVKFQLTGAASSITTLAAKIYLAKISNGVTGSEVEAVSTVAADSGNTFRYADGQYIFNLDTKGMSQGTWQIRIDLLDGATHTVMMSLQR